MNKPNSLKTHLLAAVPELANNPDRLLVFIDNGSARSTVEAGLSFEYSYTLNVILTEFAGHPDAVFIPLLAWLMVNQHELLANQDKGKEAVAFEADVLDNSKVDLSIKLPLTERVIVKKLDDGRLEVTHPDEPQLEPFLPAGNWQLYAENMLLAQWQSTASDALGDLDMPHPPVAMDKLSALEDWAGALLAKLEPGERQRLNQSIGRKLRRSQQQRVAAQRNLDGSPYAKRKPKQLRGKAGRIKRQMFSKLRQARYLRLQSTPDAIAIAFLGRVARIARVHQEGLRDRPERGQAEVQYERRELLGFTDTEIDMIRDELVQHLVS